MVTLKQLSRSLLDALADLVYPPHCVACGKMGCWLCHECLGRMPEGLPAAQPEAETVLQGLYSVYPHTGAVQRAVHALKYEGVRVLSVPLGEMLYRRWAATGEHVDWIVPVPLHRRRAKQRGYNQSQLLATELARQLTVPLAPGMLARARETTSQVGLGHQQRWDNVWGAFVCADDRVQGARVLLIDDVYTTGATLEACAWALLEGGRPERRGADADVCFEGRRCQRREAAVTPNRRSNRPSGLPRGPVLWSGRRDLNARQPAWKAGALPTELRPP